MKRTTFVIIAAIIVVVAIGAIWVLRGDTAKLPETAAIGPSPTLPRPTKTPIPTVHIAPAKVGRPVPSRWPQPG